MKNKNLQLALAIIISAVGLFFSFRGIEWQNFLQELSSVNIYWYIAGMLGMIVILLIRALRWRIFLLPMGSFSTIKLYKGTIAGFFTNYILPFRIGEVVRAYITGQFINKKGTVLLPSIVIERMIDGLSFFLFVVIFSLFIDLPLTDKQITLVRVLLIAILLIFIIAIYLYYRLREKITNYLESKETKIAGFFKDLHHGMLALFKVRHPFKIFLYSSSIWFVTGLTYWAGIKACHLELGFIEAYILMAAAMIAIAIPAAPGFVGTFHAAMVATLVALNIDKSAAASYAFLQHLIGLIPICVFGFIHFLEANISLKDIKKMQEE
ncbi:MAG: lysylphosphatidylglycerol synthase transmembrane domain-containing protein [Candidatus Marinimicrobia bacterium]|nr:lysylphosphatidylglycerol synthase transmembrane domain-containing protein [Candidatus Neomarinimicrobiota bacterium]